MRAKIRAGLLVLGCASLTTTAHASGGDLIWPDAATYMLVGVPLAGNVAFTTIDIVAAARGRQLPRVYAGLELGLCGAQVALLTAITLDLELNDPYLLGYTAWSAGLAAHGLVSLVTSPDWTRPQRQRGARAWDVVATPVARGPGGHVTLVGVW